MGSLSRTRMSFRTDVGDRLDWSIEDVGDLPLDRLAPYRMPRSHRKQRHMPGWYWCESMNAHVFYESRLELTALRSLDFDTGVSGVWAQPFQLSFKPSVSQDRRLHVPDYLARRQGGRNLLVDVKRAEEASTEKFRRVEALTRHACDEVGLDYSVISEFEPAYRMNLEWLAHYRHRSRMTEHFEDTLVELLAGAGEATVDELSRGCGDPFLSMPVVFHLMWKQVFSFDVSATLTERTVLTINPRGEINA